MLRAHHYPHVAAATLASAVLAWAVLPLAGCASEQQQVEDRRNRIAAPAISHIVLIQLKDPTRSAELVQDCNQSLPGISSVQAYACGQPLSMQRPNVLEDYTVGIYVAFANEDGYKAYADDPAHLALVERWRTAWKDVRIYDFLDMPHPPVRIAPAAAAPAAPVAAPAR